MNFQSLRKVEDLIKLNGQIEITVVDRNGSSRNIVIETDNPEEAIADIKFYEIEHDVYL